MLRTRRRIFPAQSIAVILGALDAASTPVRGIVAILGRKHRTCSAREKNEEKKLTHRHNLGTLNVTYPVRLGR